MFILLRIKIFSDIQSAFHPGDSTINQLLSITQEIYNVFEHHHDTHAVFLDISKAFDKGWHDGLSLKLRSSGISGLLVKLLSEFLSEHYQRILEKGKSFLLRDDHSWRPPRVSARTPSFLSLQKGSCRHCNI